VNSKIKISVLASLFAGASCVNSSTMQDSCPIRTVRSANNLENVLSRVDYDGRSDYDKSEKDILTLTEQLRELSKSTVRVNCHVFFEGEKNDSGELKEAYWSVLGTALINPETKEEYVLTLTEGVLPPQIIGKKIVKWENKVGDYYLIPELGNYNEDHSLGLFLVLNCPEQDGCLKPYLGKFISANLGAEDFISGSYVGKNGSDKDWFYGHVEGIEKMMGFIPMKTIVQMHSGKTDFGAGVYAFKKGQPYFAGPIVEAKDDVIKLKSAEKLIEFMKGHKLGKFYLQEE